MNTSRPTSRVLIVEDDEEQLTDLGRMVASFGYTAVLASTGEKALECLSSSKIDALVTDLIMPGVDGLDLLRRMKGRVESIPAIVLTAFGSIDKAMSVVLDLKAFWFLEKPVQPKVLRALLERALLQRSLIAETDQLSRQLSHRGLLGDMVGSSAAMAQIYYTIRQVAPTCASVLVTGESGTGKELVARAIHRLSRRPGGPFVAVNCAALPATLMESELFGYEKGAFTGAVERRAGCFEQADGGTLLLDEIGEMAAATQAKLLRVLEDSRVRRLGAKVDCKVDVRVIAATNCDLESAIKNQQFREDLLYRLKVFTIALPPLRSRLQDLPELIEAILAALNEKHGCRVTDVNAEVLRHFEGYNWPGNVRELRNVLERATIIAGEGTIEMRHLPDAFRDTPTAFLTANSFGDEIQLRPGSKLSDLEEAYIRMTLKLNANNKRKTAELLGISERTLYSRLAEYETRQPS
ncbi:MAG: sigma-54 dependent transcriptional regulator [Bryobacteraceae bacterium]